MTEEQREALIAEWQRNEKRLQELPANHQERSRLLARQDEIEYQLGLDDLEKRRK